MRFGALIVVLLLAACGQAPSATEAGGTRDMMAPAAKEGGAVASMDVAEAIAPEPPPGTPGVPPVGSVAQIAYSYAMALELPAKKVVPLRDAHVKACTDAGIQQCQLIGSSAQSQGADYVTAEVRLRGAPRWLEGFRARLAASAAAADGRVLNNSIASEDLTRQMIDSAAQLRAKTTLRDRLQGLLANRQGKLGELLEVERELARVQGEIDSMQSQLAAMQARVAMSDLVISYQSAGVPLSDQTANPVVAALNDFLQIVSQGLAGLIRLLAFLLPWLLVLVPLLWWLRRRWRASAARRQLADSEPAA